MPSRRLPFLTLAATVAGLALPGSAHAAWFPGDLIDNGPVRAIGNADVATDGTGGVVYLRQEGDVDRVVVSRMLSGGLRPPEVIDGGLGGSGSSPVLVALSNGGLLAVWNADGRLAVATAGPTTPFSAAQPIFDERANGRSVTHVAADASLYGVPYVVFTVADTAGGGNADVRTARQVNGRWVVEQQPLDADPPRNAGNAAALRPDVSASPDGTALAVWGEEAGDGRSHVYARRVTRRGVGSTVRDVSLPELEGRAAGNADSADVALEYDSSYGWVVFRQAFDDVVPRTRVIARRLVGSEFDPPVIIDGLSFPAAEGAGDPRIDIDGRGRGLVTLSRDTTNQVFGALLRDDQLQAPQRLDTAGSAVPPFAHPAVAENATASIAWQQGGGVGQPNVVKGRSFVDDAWQPEVDLSRPELGSADGERGLSITADRSGNVLVAFVQGGLLDARLVAAVFDRPPGRAGSVDTPPWERRFRPTLKWAKAFDLWGDPTYRVFLNGVEIGQTTRASLVPPTNLAEGIHRWTVVTRDRRGQEAFGASRLLRIDRTLPQAVLSAPRTVRLGREAITVTTLSDPQPGALPPPKQGTTPAPQSSGVGRVIVDFGDGSRRKVRESPRNPITRMRAGHRYTRPGLFTVTVRAFDRAGNAVRVTQRIRVARPPRPPRENQN